MPYKPRRRVEAMDKGRHSRGDSPYANGLRIHGSQVQRGKEHSKVRKRISAKPRRKKETAMSKNITTSSNWLEQRLLEADK